MKPNENIVALGARLTEAMEAFVGSLVQEVNVIPPKVEWTENNVPRYYTVEQIAKAINVSAVSVRRWCRNGEIPYTKFGRVMRISPEDWKRYCRENKITVH